MVAIVSGISPGLDLSSRAVLGSPGAIGNAVEGRNGQGVYVNVSTGAVLVQNQDDYLATRGVDHSVLRTYNSNGSFDDDNGDQWRADQLSLQLFGSLNSVGSTIHRTDRDGSVAVYTYDSSRNLYQTSDGSGAYDTITHIAADGQFEWRDGTTGNTDRYEDGGAYRILSRRDGVGNGLTYAYGTSGLLSAITTSSGDTVLYDYAGTNLAQVRTISGGVTTTRVRYGYDSSNRLETVTVDLTPGDNSVLDGKTYVTRYGYDGTSKRLASIAQSDGTSLAIGYVDVGGGNFKVATIRDGLNQTTTFAYGAGYATVTDALNLTTRYEYDGQNQLTRIVAPAVSGASATRQFAYSGSGDVLSATDGEGRTVNFGYDSQGNQVLQRDQAGTTVTRTFDGRNQLLTETVYLMADPDGTGAASPADPRTTRYVYDDAGRNQLRFVLTPEGRVTEHRYNGFGERITSVTFASGLYPVGSLAVQAPLSETDLVTWAAAQNLTATQRVDYAYDGLGQLRTRTGYGNIAANGLGVADASRSVEQYVYDTAGRLLQTIAPSGGTTSYSYDGLGRLLTSTDALQRTTVTAYDDAGSKVSVTLASGLVTTSAFDAAGRLVAVTQPGPSQVVLGQTKHFYDAGNRLRMTEDPTGVRNWMLYDEAGRLVAEIDGNGTITEHVYNRADQVVSTVKFGTAVATSALADAAGLPVLSVTLASIRPAAGSADQTAWKQYDAAGRLVRVADQIGSGSRASVTETRYDGASRVVQVVRYATKLSVGAFAPGAVPLPVASDLDRSMRNFYDSDGKLTGTLDAEGYLTTFTYDAAGRLIERNAYASPTDSALRAGGSLAELVPAPSANDIREVTVYDAKGLVIAQVDGEACLTENVYDANGRLTQSVRYATRVSAPVSTGSSVAAIRPAASAEDRSTTRIYDDLGRLSQETDPEGVVTRYAYDTAGNLTSTVRAVGTVEARSLLARYDVQGRLIAELSAEGGALLTGGQTQAQVDAIWAQYGTMHTYDAAGRRSSSTDATGNRTLFFYNADGALTHRINALGEIQETRYDARGRAVEQIAYGTRISTTGLAGGLVPDTLTTALTALANTAIDSRTIISYGRDGSVQTTKDAVGTAVTSVYNAFGDEVSRSTFGTGVNLVETFTVDRRGLRIAASADAPYLNSATSFAAYDAFGRMIRSVDANGHSTETTYDRLGRVLTVRDPVNATRVTTYDAFARVLTQKDALGQTTTYSYDKSARTVRVTTPEGIAVTTTFNRHGQVLSFQDGRLNTTTYAYDANGRLRRTDLPMATVTQDYDAAGRLTTSRDANGNKVVYGYDGANRVLTRTVDPDGLNLVTTYAYDAKGQSIKTTAPGGTVTATEYDLNGRVLKQTVDPDGLKLQTVYTYDARGNTLTVKAPGGSITEYIYDALGRRTEERVDRAGLDLRRTWAYDKNGNVTSSVDARGFTTRYVYDAANRLAYTIDPSGGVSHQSYDAEGRIVRSVVHARPIDSAGLSAAPSAEEVLARLSADPAQDQVEHRVYDRDGRLSATVDATGAVVRYTYDANGNTTSRVAHALRINMGAWLPGTDPVPVADATRDSRQTTVYDAMNRAIYTMNATGAVVAMTYDGNGNVLRRTAYAAPIQPATATTQTAISAAVDAVADTARDATTRNTYDAAGRLTWSVDGTGAVTRRTFDKNGNLVEVLAYANRIAPEASASSAASSGNDRTTSMAYDGANRLVLEVDASRAVTEYVRDANGNLLRRTAYSKAIASVPALGTNSTANAIRALLAPNTALDRSTLAGYDGAGRQVLSIDPAGAATQRGYDAAGNVTSITAYSQLLNTAGLPEAPSLDQLKTLLRAAPAVDRQTLNAYDASGRLVYTVDPAGAVTQTEYDGIDRIKWTRRYAKALSTSPDPTVNGIAAAVAQISDPLRDRMEAFAYNAAGHLIARTDAEGNSESYGVDALGLRRTFVNAKGAQWTYEYNAAGMMVRETSPEAWLAGPANVGGATLGQVAMTQGRIVTVLGYDALGNLTSRTEAAGRPEERTTNYEYDALGHQVRVIHPAVGVYNAAADAPTVNGASSIAERIETVQRLETQTWYDAFGNAVASRDVGGALSQKAYDPTGKVAYEIDALGFVTGYFRNAYGEVEKLVRYGAGTSLAGISLSTAAQATGKSQVEAVLNASGFDHSRDRALVSSHDRAGRVTETVQPLAFVYDYAASGALAGDVAAATRYQYDAFGQAVQVSRLRNAANAWAATTHYFDKAGREIASIDALGYLTERVYDAAGNLEKTTEFANALTQPWTLTDHSRPVADTQRDRTVQHAYDRMNRRLTETRVNVEFSTASDGTSQFGDLVTIYGYDALGNQTTVTDASGGVTSTYYDALGCISAVVAPARPVNGLSIAPLTEFRRDAYGNVVAKVEYANAGIGGTATVAPVAVPDPAADRITLSAYDSFGRLVQSTDANGHSEYFSYDAFGHVTKHWQGVTGNDGVTRTRFELSAYDKLGRLVQSSTPASTSVYDATAGVTSVSQAQAGVVAVDVEYNGFGEVIRKGVQGGRQEYFEYDNSGRLWRTNAGDGVDRVNLYDAAGNVTAEIRSSGSGRANTDVRSFVNAKAAADDPYTRRVDIQYDAMGRVVARLEAERQETQGGVFVRRQFLTSVINESAAAVPNDTLGTSVTGSNRITLGWNSLAGLGSGDVRVTLHYRSPLGTAKTYTSGVLASDQSASGTVLAWSDSPFITAGTDVGVASISRIVVHKKDINGQWQVIMDQPQGYGASEITVAAPANALTGVKLELRAAGSTGDAGWWEAALVDMGASYRFDARGLAVGAYEYRVSVTPLAEGPRVTGTGTVSITLPPLNAIATPLAFGQLGASLLSWQVPGAEYTQALRYRVNGSTGAWSSLPVQVHPYSTSTNFVEFAGLGAGTYQFELLWTSVSQGVPTAHATGTVTVVAALPAYWVPPVNLPPITGLSIGTTVVGGSFFGFNEYNQPIYYGGTTVPAIVWDAANATMVRYRAAGGPWISLPIDSIGQFFVDGGPTGYQKAPLDSVPAGTYEVQILAGSPATAQATGSFTIYPTIPGYYTTVTEQVPTYERIIDHYEPIYENRLGTTTVTYQEWVVDGRRIIGYDESGFPIYETYGHYETRERTESLFYQVQIGETPVYATDEFGNYIYRVVWVTQQRQVWVPPVTTTPTIAVTTPPYTPGYWVPGVPAQYGISVATAAASTALSTTEGRDIGQNAGLNGDARWLRPTISQKTDRWGNVVETSDPRSASWKTTYTYNASNQLLQQTQPGASGAMGADSPVSRLYYDKLGRQVATRDARGLVNGQSFDAGGNLVEERHADAGIVTHGYNAFGDRTRTLDAMGNTVSFTYDHVGRLLSTNKGSAVVYSVNGANTLNAGILRDIVDSWSYDELGRKLTQKNGNGEVVRYTYDLRGNVVATTQPMGENSRAAFDAEGRKIAELDANGNKLAWSYDGFGRLTGHTDLEGYKSTYTYDNARQLISQTSTRGQSLTYAYDAAGQVTTITDWATGKTTTYMYDLSGRRIRERVVQGEATYQDNHLAYDVLGRLRDVADARVHLTMEYDAVGNRTRVTTSVDYQGVLGEASHSSDRFFQYDAMNRQVVVDAVDAAGSLGQQGHSITYDKNGNRTSDYFYGNKVAASNKTITGYEESGIAYVIASGTVYTATPGYTTETYRYDRLNRLQGVERDGTQVDVRLYDGADRVVQSGPAGNLPQAYAAELNKNLAPGETNGLETRINRYDANGRILHQKVLKSDNAAKVDISWDVNEVVEGRVPRLATEGIVFDTVYYSANGYDQVGNALGYTVKNQETGAVTEYETTLHRQEGYQAKTRSGVATNLNPGTLTQDYDANGYLIRVRDTTQPKNDRTFVNDASGRALFVEQAGNVRRQLIANGEVLGLYGVGVDLKDPYSDSTNNPNFANLVDFDFGYAKVTSTYPAPAPGAFQVQAGDTLQSIAQAAYGDSALWFRIAEANGLTSSSELKVGQTLNIPSQVGTINNNSTTFKPYDPSRIEGDLTPNLPMSPKDECGVVGQLLMVIVTIVVAIYSGGGAVGAVVGAIAGQAVGLVTGTIDTFNWKSVALAAVGGALSAGLPSFGLEGPLATAVRAAIANAFTQGVAVALGVQPKFDWRGVAASAAGAVIGEAVRDVMLGPETSGNLEGVARTGTVRSGSEFTRSFENSPNLARFLSEATIGLVRGVTVAAMRGGRVAMQQVAVDAFGNALGQGLADAASSSATLVTGTSGTDVGRGGEELKVPADGYGQWSADVKTAGAGGGAIAVYLNQDQEARLNTGQTMSDVYSGDVDGVTARLGLQARSKFGLSAVTPDVGPAAAPVADTQSSYNPMGDYPNLTGPEIATTESLQALSGYGMQMRKVGGFFGNLAVGGVKGLDNFIPETAALAYRLTGYGAAGLVSLVSTDVSDQMFAQYERVNGRWIDYDNPIQEFGGLSAQLATPGLVKGLSSAAMKLGSALLADSRVIGTVDGVSDYAAFRANFVGPTLGKSGFIATSELGDASFLRYQNYVDDAYDAALVAEARGLLKGNPNTRIGTAVDQRSATRFGSWLDSEGIPEGVRGIVQMNRWLRDPVGTGLYVRPDIRIPGATLSLDATVGIKWGTDTQIMRFSSFSGGDRITIVRPQQLGGSYSIWPR